MMAQNGPIQQTINLLSSQFADDNIRTAGQQELINFFRTSYPVEDSGRQGFKLLRTPGCIEWQDMSVSEFRATIALKNIGYMVSDTTLKTLTLTGTTPPATVSASKGTVTLTGRCSIGALNDEIIINNGTVSYSYKVTAGTFATIGSGLPNDESHIIVHNEKVLFIVKNSNKIYVSDLTDGRTIQSANYFTVTSDYENVITGLATPDYVYFWAENSGAVYSDTGVVFQPYTKISQGSIRVGCAAKFSPIEIMGRGFFLSKKDGKTLGMFVCNGAELTPISPEYMVAEINTYADITDAYSWSHTVDGNVFLNITFPSTEYVEITDHYIGKTWSYNLVTQEWNIMLSHNISNYGQTQHRAQTVMYLDDKILFGDAQSSSIMELSHNYYDEDGEQIIRSVKTQHFYAADKTVEITNMRVTMEPGKGGSGETPKLIGQVSKNWGATFGIEKWRTVSQIGQYKQQARFSSWGSAEVMTFLFTVSDSIDWCLTGATAQVIVYR